MAVDFNHTIVWAQDSQASATLLAEVLGLPAPRRWGPFLVVTTDNGTTSISWMPTATLLHSTVPKRNGVRRNFWSGSGTVASLLGRSHANASG